METLEQILQGMGQTVEQVRQCLQDNHITGRPNSSCHCPIANYIKAKGYDNVSVGHYDVGTYGLNGIHEEALLPSSVSMFIHCFDTQNKFPELLEDK